MRKRSRLCIKGKVLKVIYYLNSYSSSHVIQFQYEMSKYITTIMSAWGRSFLVCGQNGLRLVSVKLLRVYTCQMIALHIIKVSSVPSYAF